MRHVSMTRHPLGPRVHLFNQRIHHGLFGVALLALGAALVAHDWHDRPWYLKDRDDWMQR